LSRSSPPRSTVRCSAQNAQYGAWRPFASNAPETVPAGWCGSRFRMQENSTRPSRRGPSWGEQMVEMARRRATRQRP
jgi:hypothetical protein